MEAFFVQYNFVKNNYRIFSTFIIKIKKIKYKILNSSLNKITVSTKT